MSNDFLAALNKVTPLCDKILAVIGGTTAGFLTLGQLQTSVGIAVGVVTLFVMIPRAILAWGDMLRKVRGEKSERRREE